MKSITNINVIWFDEVRLGAAWLFEFLLKVSLFFFFCSLSVSLALCLSRSLSPLSLSRSLSLPSLFLSFSLSIYISLYISLSLPLSHTHFTPLVFSSCEFLFYSACLFVCQSVSVCLPVCLSNFFIPSIQYSIRSSRHFKIE